ncbi:MAG TPA: hypothetical protein VM101_16685 [Flavitalea sp.]|nr:hypothetical protein [Flavitalea sp.]
MKAFMKPRIKHIIPISCFLLLFSFAQAQVNVRSNIDHDNILIGERLTLVVEAYVPTGAAVKWFNTDTIAHFEILNQPRPDTAQSIDAKKITESFDLTSFDSGVQYIPPFEIIVEGQSYFTDSIAINVSFTPFNPDEDYKDIKDIIEVKNPTVKYIPWLVGGLALSCLALAVYLWFRRKFATKNLKEEEVHLLTPYEEAMQALQKLALRNLNNGDAKIYYSEMNDILRRYVSRKFSVSTFARTNEELILELSVMSIPKDAFISLAQSLRMSDFVKFAKYRPSDDDNTNNLKIVTSSIEILDKNITGAV